MSIIIPLFNQKKEFLVEAIESAIAQTYANLEIIISNNHSTDVECIDTLQHYAHIDSRIKLLSPPKFVPIAQNFNFGASESTGKYITFLCSDDRLVSGFISDAIEMILSCKHTISFLYSYSAFFNSDDNNKILSYVHKRDRGFINQKDAFRLFITGKEGSMGGAIFERDSYFKSGGTSERVSFTGDTYLFNFILREGGCLFLDKTYYFIRIWERAEQQNRLAQNINDVNVLYDDILNDTTLLNFADNNRKLIENARKLKLLGFIYPLQQLNSYTQKDPTVEKEAKRLLLKSFSGSWAKQIMINNVHNLIGKIIFKIYYILVIKKG